MRLRRGLVHERERSGMAQKGRRTKQREPPEGVSPGLWVGSERRRRKGVCARLVGKSAWGVGSGRATS